MFGGKIPHIDKNMLFMNTNNDIIFKGEYIVKTMNPEKTYELTDDFVVREIAAPPSKISDDLVFDEVYSDNDIKITDKITLYVDLAEYPTTRIEEYMSSVLKKMSPHSSPPWFNKVVRKDFCFVMSYDSVSNNYRYVGLTAKPNLLNRYTFIYKFVDILRILYNEKYDGFDAINKMYNDNQRQQLIDLEKDIMEIFEDETHRFYPAKVDKKHNKWETQRFHHLTKEQLASNDVIKKRYVNFCDMIAVITAYTENIEDKIKDIANRPEYKDNPPPKSELYKEYIDGKYISYINQDADIKKYDDYLIRDIRDIFYYRNEVIKVLDKDAPDNEELPSIKVFMMYLYERLNKKQLSLGDRGGNILPVSFKTSIKALGIDVSEYEYKVLYPYWTTYSYTYKGIDFAGCCETGIIEFIKAVSYNPVESAFDPSVLPETTVPELKKFMKKYKPSQYGTSPSYNLELMKNLLDIFENRENITYKKSAEGANGETIRYEWFSIDFFNILSALFGVEVTENNIDSIIHNEKTFIEKIRSQKINGQNNVDIEFKNGVSLNINIKEGHVMVTFKKAEVHISLKNRMINGTFYPRTKKELKYAIRNQDRIPVPIGKWDVSRITDMSELFSDIHIDNIDGISSWNVSNVLNMSYMFSGFSGFNVSLNRWNVSNVRNMSYMFFKCIQFDQTLNSWKVGNVTDMEGMFYGCMSFNKTLNAWDVGNVTSMGGMFSGCEDFNQPLDKWNVSKVRDMSYMFKRCYQFNQQLDSWNVSNVQHMDSMFNRCIAFDQPLNKWNVSNVINMENIFAGCTNYKQPLYWKLNENVINNGTFMLPATYPHFDKGIGLLVAPENTGKYEKSIESYKKNSHRQKGKKTFSKKGKIFSQSSFMRKTRKSVAKRK